MAAHGNRERDHSVSPAEDLLFLLSLRRAHASVARRPNRRADAEGSGTKKTLGWRFVRSVFLMMMSERRVSRRRSSSKGVNSGSHSYQKRSASRRRSNWKRKP